MRKTIQKFSISNELDIVLARKRAKKIASLLGFDNISQIKIATAVSELARNAYMYAQNGYIEFFICNQNGENFLMIEVSDRGKGIPNLDDILQGKYLSKTGMGMGLIGTKNIMDIFKIETGELGTQILIGKEIKSTDELDDVYIDKLLASLSSDEPESIAEEILIQNKEIIKTLEEINRKKEELERLNRELHSTNKNLVNTQEILKDIATKDPLTGVYNRIKLNEILPIEINRTLRYDYPLSFIMLDIDFFKKVNDTYGHQAGDDVLKVLANVLQNAIRKTDFVFRYGGEEFCILTTNTDGEKALLVAERIRLKIAETDFGIPQQVTASLGVTQYVKPESEEEFIKRSDEALYIAKRTGRNKAILL